VTTYDVRPATPEDAVRMCEVRVAVWREAYAGLMPPQYLAGLDPARDVARFAERLATPEPGRVLLVGTADDRVVGMASAGPSRDDPPEPPVEVYAVNVLAAHHGTGLGARLFETALDAVAGDGPVSLWVAEGNGRARSFYRRYGFVPDGRTKHLDDAEIDVVRLVRPAR
jgi:GNAT superfamily N-acetyltransferase